jgi:COP9 signalosome complex subunit 4
MTKLPDDDSQSISHFLLDRVQPRVISFEEQVATIRQHLAGIYERQDQWREAANVLGLIPLETGQRFVYNFTINFNDAKNNLFTDNTRSITS